jgi:hypothetical protein
MVLNIVLNSWIGDALFTDSWKLSKNGIEPIGGFSWRYTLAQLASFPGRNSFEILT